MEQNTLELLQSLAKELNKAFNFELKDALDTEKDMMIWCMMLAAYAHGKGYPPKTFNGMLEDSLPDAKNLEEVVTTLWEVTND